MNFSQILTVTTGFSVALGTFFSVEMMYAVGRPKAQDFRGGVSNGMDLALCFTLECVLLMSGQVSVLKEETVGTSKRLNFVSEVQGQEVRRVICHTCQYTLIAKLSCYGKF